jgi:hypothetical protein
MGRPQFFSPEEIARRNDPSASPNTPILSPRTPSNAYVLPPYQRNSLQTQPSMQQNSASNMGNGSGRAGVAPRFPLEFDAAPDSRDELLDSADSDEYNRNYEELRPFLRREIASSDEGFSPAGHHGASPWDLRPTAAPLESAPTSFNRLGSLGSSGNPATPGSSISPWEALSRTQVHLAASYGRRPSSRQEPMEYRSVFTGARLRNGIPYPPHPAPEQLRADPPPTQGGQHSISFLSVGDPQPRFDAPNRRPTGEVLIPWNVLVHYRELGGLIRGVRLNEDESWMVWLQGPQLEQSLEDLGYNQLTSYFEDLNAQCVRVSVQPAQDPDYIAYLSRGGLGPSFRDATFLHNLTARYS